MKIDWPFTLIVLALLFLVGMRVHDHIENDCVCRSNIE